jgi:tetratricopeptide (TPR) repeat protein
MRAAFAAILAVALVAPTARIAPVHAQPTPDNRAKAASHFKQGQLYFKNGDFDRALTEYQAAYELSKEPLLVFNIALCHDRAQRPEKALELFQQYLDLAPDGEVADEARENVARLTPIVEQLHTKEKDAEQAEAKRRIEELRRADEQRRATEASAAAAREQKRKQREADLAPREHRAALEKITGLVAGGVGIAGLALGVVYGREAASDADAINAHTMGAWTDAVLAHQDAGQSASTNAIVFTAVGGACLLAGATLYLLGRHTQGEVDEQRLELHAGPAAGGAQASMLVRF